MHRTSPTQDDPLSFSLIKVLWDGLFFLKKKKDLYLTNKPPATDCKTAWYNWLPPDFLSLKQPQVDSFLPITIRCEEYNVQARCTILGTNSVVLAHLRGGPGAPPPVNVSPVLPC